MMLLLVQVSSNNVPANLRKPSCHNVVHGLMGTKSPGKFFGQQGRWPTTSFQPPRAPIWSTKWFQSRSLQCNQCWWLNSCGYSHQFFCGQQEEKNWQIFVFFPCLPLISFSQSLTPMHTFYQVVNTHTWIHFWVLTIESNYSRQNRRDSNWLKLILRSSVNTWRQNNFGVYWVYGEAQESWPQTRRDCQFLCRAVLKTWQRLQSTRLAGRIQWQFIWGHWHFVTIGHMFAA